MEGLLRYEGYKITAHNDHVYNFVIAISTGSISFEEIVEWLKSNTKAI